MGAKQRLAGALAVPARAYVRHTTVPFGKKMLVRRLLEPALRGAPRTFVADTVDGFAVAGSTQDMIQRYLYVFGVWEPAVTQWLRGRLGPGRTLVDVGANIGYFSLLGSGLVGADGGVVAVEALPETFRLLQGNLARNGVTNVRAVNVAATAEAGTVTLYGGEAHNSGTTTSLAAAGLQELATVDGLPLAQLLTPHEVATARVVKIDVEGAELDVLRGLAPALDDMPDDVELAVEVSPADLVAAGHSPTAPLDLLAEHGFVGYRIDNSYAPVTYLDRATPRPPTRCHGPLHERTDLVFSRTDADTLP